MTRKALVVDDDPTTVALCCGILEDMGLQARAAPNGAACLVMVANEIPDLIVLDIRMPVMDGFQALQVLRVHGIRTPILMLTACDDDCDVTHAWQLGVTSYLTKPFSVDQFTLMVTRMLDEQPELEDMAAEAMLAEGEPIGAHAVAK